MDFSPAKIPRNWPIFLWICPWKSFEIWLFCAKMRRNRPIFLRILTFLPQNRPIFPRMLTFSRENPAKSAYFSANLPLKIPRNFAFFSAKYQKPCESDVVVFGVTVTANSPYFCVDSGMYEQSNKSWKRRASLERGTKNTHCLFCIRYVHSNYPLLPATGNSNWLNFDPSC